MADESVIMVCESCGGVEFIAGDGDPWEAFTKTIRRHQESNGRCRGARQWIGQSLQDCPIKVREADGPVN